MIAIARICLVLTLLMLGAGFAYAQTIDVSAVSKPVPLWLVLMGLIVILIAGYLFLRKAAKHPATFQRYFENPLDSGLQALADAKWTPTQIDQFLLEVKNKDLTAKAAGAYQQVPPQIVQAAEMISAWARSKGPTPPAPPA